jgi:tetratricopeptide (TPR) repeat protein
MDRRAFHDFDTGTVVAHGVAVSVAFSLAMLVGCGKHTETYTKPTTTTPAAAKARPASPGLKDFDAGLRALKLGGPEANERAAEAFGRATSADPSLWEAWYDLGVVRWRLGDDRGAVAAFGKAEALAPGRAEIRVARAEALRRLRKLGDARADYEAALKQEPADNATRLRLASLLREGGDTDGSVKAVREVLRRNPQGRELADANVELGTVYLAAGKMELAELVLSKAAQADPKNPRVWNALGMLALKQGKDQEAFQRLDHATDLDPSFRDARFNKATVLLDAGDYAQARAELVAALKGLDDGGDLDALVALGVAQRGLGKYDDARATWERVLRVAPMHADALYDLAVLAMDFLRDEGQARGYLTRYLAAAPDEHPRQKEAQQRMSELGPAPAPPAPPTSQPTVKR